MVDVNKFGRDDHGIDDPGLAFTANLPKVKRDSEHDVLPGPAAHRVLYRLVAGPGESFIGRSNHFWSGHRIG